MSAVQSDKVCVCDSCGLSLPTVTPIVATEPVGDAEPVVVVEPEVIAAVEVAVEPEVIASPKMDAESNTTIQLDELKELNQRTVAVPIQSNDKTGFEIRLVLADCSCGRPNLILGKQIIENEPEIPLPDVVSTESSDEEDETAAEENETTAEETENDDDDGAEETENNVDETSPVIVISEGHASDEADWNVCQLWGKHWRQFTSVVPGLLLLLTIGAHNVFTVYELDVFNNRPLLNPNRIQSNDYQMYFENPPRPRKSDYTFYVIVAWFVGAVVGNLLGATLLRSLKKRSIYYFAALLQIAAGIVFVLYRHDQHSSNLSFIQRSHASLGLSHFTLGLAARLLSGLVSALVYLTVTVHASDIASKRMRRVISYTIVTTIASSTLFYSLATQIAWNSRGRTLIGDVYSFDFNMIASGVLVLLLTPLFTNEPTTYYLLRGKVAKAQKRFAKLNSERSNKPSAEILEKFDELQLMVREDTENGTNIFGGGNFKPFFIVLCARLLKLFLTSAATISLIMMTASAMQMQTRSLDGGNFIELNALQIIVGTISLTLAACMGRHKFYYVSGIVLPILSAAAVFGAPFVFGIAQTQTYAFVISAVGIFAHLSLGLDYYQQKQSADAFTVTKKVWSLATIGVLEQLAHAGLILAYVVSKRETTVLLIGSGIAIVLFSIIQLTLVPETRKLSLRETRNKFNAAMRQITFTNESAV